MLLRRAGSQLRTCGARLLTHSLQKQDLVALCPWLQAPAAAWCHSTRQVPSERTQDGKEDGDTQQGAHAWAMTRVSKHGGRASAHAPIAKRKQQASRDEDVWRSQPPAGIIGAPHKSRCKQQLCRGQAAAADAAAITSKLAAAFVPGAAAAAAAAAAGGAAAALRPWLGLLLRLCCRPWLRLLLRLRCRPRVGLQLRLRFRPGLELLLRWRLQGSRP